MNPFYPPENPEPKPVADRLGPNAARTIRARICEGYRRFPVAPTVWAEQGNDCPPFRPGLQTLGTVRVSGVPVTLFGEVG